MTALDWAIANEYDDVIRLLQQSTAIEINKVSIL